MHEAKATFRFRIILQDITYICKHITVLMLSRSTSIRSYPLSHHILEKAQVPLVCCCKSPLLVPPLKLSCINILSARDSTPVDPGHLNREYQHSIGHPSWEPRFSNRVSLHLSKSTQWRGVSKKGRWAVRAKRQMRHADMQVKALHPTNVCGRRDGL
jgi:hypothetical protein